MIEINGLSKRYPPQKKLFGSIGNRNGKRWAVREVDLYVGRGELFGLIGPNGAGKTTLIKLLSTMILPTSGNVRIGGYDIKKESAVKKIIGLATSDERSFYWRLSGRQNLKFFTALYGIHGKKAELRAEELIEQVDLKEVIDRRFHTYSTGLRQRLAIARALITNPKVVFLDEPTKGLDPRATRHLNSLIRDHLVENLGLTVFLSSHQLVEIEALCHRVAIMHRGRIRGCGTIEELRSSLGPVEQYRIEARGLKPEVSAALVAAHQGLVMSRPDENLTLFEFEKENGSKRMDAVIDAIRNNGGELWNLSCNPISLSTIFEKLTEETEQGSLPSIALNTGTKDDAASKPSAHCSSQRREDDNSDSGRNASNTAECEAAGCNCASSGAAVLTRDGQLDPIDNSSSHVEKTKNRTSRMMRKLLTIGSFIRRDMLEETSYRFSFFMQIIEILMTVTVIFFFSKMLPPEVMGKYLNRYGGDYFTFAIIGIAFYGYFRVGISIYSKTVRQAQTTGTLEAMLSTPDRPFYDHHEFFFVELSHDDIQSAGLFGCGKTVRCIELSGG